MAARTAPRRAAIAILLAAAALVPGAAGDAGAGGVDFKDGWVARAAGSGDFDGDGEPDLVLAQEYLTAGRQRGRVLVHYGDPAAPGRYAARDEFDCGPNPADLLVADLDGNLLPDLATVSAIDGTVTVILQVAAATFVRFDFAAVGRGTGIAAGDLNGDGFADLAIAGRDDLAVIFQDSVTPGVFLPAVPLPTTEEPVCVAVGDVNGDGFQDLVYGARQGMAFQAQVAAAPGSFDPEVVIPTRARRIGRIAAGDFDGDGRDDFAIAARGTRPGFVGAGVSVLLHLPGGGLVFDERTVTTGPAQRHLVVADMDGDALPDLVTSGGNSLAWYRQDAANPGTFRRVRGGARAFAAADGPLAVADFDGDGAPDPLVTWFAPHFVPRKANRPNRFAKPRKYRFSG